MRIRAILFLHLALSALAHSETLVTENLYLSGRGSDDAQTWDFYCTQGRNSGFWTRIAVPSCWEQQGFGEYDYGVEFRPNDRMPQPLRAPAEQGIYRREFTVPATWRGRLVRIVFEGVLTDADVHINGVSAGPVHQGGFYRFSYDVTDKLRFDAVNQLEVTVSKRSANPSVNRAERIGDYWNFGGIFRPVRLEAVPLQHIERTAIDARADGTFSADVFLGGDLPAGNEVVVQLKNASGEPVGPPVAVAVPSGAKQVNVRTQLTGAATWTAETPNLYTAEFTLRTGGIVAAAHTIAQRFGFRTFELRPGDGLYLNGHKITMKGVCRHSFWPETGRTLSLERHQEDIRLMKAANMNAVRMSHYPPDAEFLELCDESGLYVLDELAGWQGCYDTPTGRILIAEMVKRDVNHPSILFWDNGNEGGENPENDDEFAKYDPQRRPVLHPWAPSFRGMNTRHYREYADTKKYTDGPEIFMPTEFLHGLYDGGHGAGLDDYWKLMAEKPHAAGGFLWSWMDEAVKRTDQDGRLDPRHDLGPDGIVGPHHEKEGSYETIREIWSPVQIPLATLPADFAGVFPVHNRYDFLNLSTVNFEWRLVSFGAPGVLVGQGRLVAHGELAGPDVAARAEGVLQLTLPKDWRESDALFLTARDARRRELWTWTWQWKQGTQSIPRATTTTAAVAAQDDASEMVISAGRNVARFAKATGRLSALERDGRRISLTNGPRLVAYRRTERRFEPIQVGTEKLLTLKTTADGAATVVTATYEGALREVRWTISSDGDVRMDYAVNGPGIVDILGVDFDYPEEKMKAKEWLGGGPYRVWQNRLRGVQLGRWNTSYNDPIPGESWEYPEFKGWFSNWRWMAFTTTEGRFAFLNESGQPYVGVYAPRDGRVNPVLALPRLGLGVYQVISAIGNKFSVPSNLGPQGLPQNINGMVKGSLVIRLLDQP